MMTIKLYAVMLLASTCILTASFCFQHTEKNSEPLIGTWVLSHVYPSKADTFQFENLVMFQIEKGGMTAGFMGCNKFRTECKTKGDSIFFSSILSSRKFCKKEYMDLEDQFKNTLSNASRYTLKLNTLTLYKEKQKLASFIKQ